MFPIALLAAALPTLIDSLSALNHNFHLFKPDEVDKIAGMASRALAGVPEAIESFLKLKTAIGGRAPTADELRALAAEIAGQSGELGDELTKAQARDAAENVTKEE